VTTTGWTFTDRERSSVIGSAAFLAGLSNISEPQRAASRRGLKHQLVHEADPIFSRLEAAHDGMLVL